MEAHELPESIRVSELSRGHPGYNGEKLRRLIALYRGGEAFKALIDQFLTWRPIERIGQGGVKPQLDRETVTDAGAVYAGSSGRGIGSQLREERKARAHYIPHKGGLINWLVAAVLKDSPSFLPPASDRDYWTKLNARTDGQQKSLKSLCFDLLADVLVCQRGWLSIASPDDDDYPSLADQRAAGRLDLTIHRIPPLEIDDWDEDPAGNLLWVRRHRSRMVRPPDSPWGKPDIQEHTWHYLLSDAVVTYKAKWKNDSESKDAIAIRESVKPHSLGIVPALRLDLPQEIWISERTEPVAVALFNREASITFALDQTAYAIPVLTGDTNEVKSDLVATEISAIKLPPGVTMQIVSANPGIFTPLFEDQKRLKLELYGVVQSLALLAASQAQNARQSGEAKAIDRAPLETLLEAFAQPLLDALTKVADVISAYRGRGEAATVHGLKSFDTREIADILAAARELADLPGCPEIARRYAAAEAAIAATPGAPADIHAAIKHDAMTQGAAGTSGSASTPEIVSAPAADTVSGNTAEGT